MAASRPLVACAAPDTDLAETIMESRAGLVVRPGDWAGLTAAVTTLLGDGTHDLWDPATALEAAHRHSPSVIAAQYDSLLRSLARQAGFGV